MSEEYERVDFAQEYQFRYGWRVKRQIQNLSELTRLITWSSDDDMKFVHKMYMARYAKQDPLYALTQSIGLLWAEAQDCFVYGKYQACILSCGAVIERCLKYEYQKAKGKIPLKRPTLGNMIYELDWREILDLRVIDEAKKILDPRNSRAHALLEADEPDTAYFGSKRSMFPVGSNEFIIEHYRGDAVEVVVSTVEILRLLYNPGEDKT